MMQFLSWFGLQTGYKVVAFGTSAEFVEYASKCTLPCLDIGGAFGAASLAAIDKGATMILNELTSKFLDYIVLNTPKSKLEKLYFIEGKITNENISFPKGSIGAIHMSRVMHFFTPSEIEELFKRAKEWLAPDGRFYILTMSPYHYAKPGIDKIYDERYKQGVKFPGEIGDFTKGDGVDKVFKGKAPEYIHAIDPRVLFRVADEHGFRVKKLELAGGEKDQDYTCAIFVNKVD
ncbi:hypothetical protein TRFO_01542 [Tritrichomonas foetus]|uniref:Methyltransferase domain-containing protein n=1 Tax=Tritrichomonas foetus TaxID=1144522 RepID=A0A1J4K269_9EUKA|nr:hypothetical protein TRFO_01542 [Tritrichomonas foetus]|eukprot:OHT03836.1 hypothetical protein TRFO_01542 [Tritrichomonas foetus]